VRDRVEEDRERDFRFDRDLLRDREREREPAALGDVTSVASGATLDCWTPFSGLALASADGDSVLARSNSITLSPTGLLTRSFVDVESDSSSR